MCKTAESFRISLDKEIDRWNGFHRALRKDDREAFEELMHAFRSYASEINCATNRIIFEPMVMSIILAQMKKIEQLEYKINDMIWQKISSRENNP